MSASTPTASIGPDYSSILRGLAGLALLAAGLADFVTSGHITADSAGLITAGGATLGVNYYHP